MPCTARPKIGSGLRIVCPPATDPPACTITSAAAAKISTIACRGKFSGKAATFTAIKTFPPMAYTSLHAFAAAIAPKSEGSSTRGGKKSVVLTKAISSLTLYTAASSKGAKPINKAGSIETGNSSTSPANKSLPHLAAQPPQLVHSVSFSGAPSNMISVI